MLCVSWAIFNIIALSHICDCILDQHEKLINVIKSELHRISGLSTNSNSNFNSFSFLLDLYYQNDNNFPGFMLCFSRRHSHISLIMITAWTFGICSRYNVFKAEFILLGDFCCWRLFSTGRLGFGGNLGKVLWDFWVMRNRNFMCRKLMWSREKFDPENHPTFKYRLNLPHPNSAQLEQNLQSSREKISKNKFFSFSNRQLNSVENLQSYLNMSWSGKSSLVLVKCHSNRWRRPVLRKKKEFHMDIVSVLEKYFFIHIFYISYHLSLAYKNTIYLQQNKK